MADSPRRQPPYSMPSSGTPAARSPEAGQPAGHHAGPRPAGGRIEGYEPWQRIVDAAPVPVARMRAPLRSGSAGRGTGRTGQDAGRPDPREKVDARIEDEGIQPVVRRRRVRPELVMVALGLIFAAGAVAKPWGSTKPPVAPTAGPTLIGVVPTAPTPAPAVNPTRSPLIPSQADPEMAALGPRGMGGRDWVEVSWLTLAVDDAHTALGVAAVGAAVVPYNGPYLPAPPLPVVTWRANSDTGEAASFAPPANGRIFAVAATWPRDLDVSAVTIGPAGPASKARAAARIKALPAGNVVLSGQSPSGATSPRSGQFWIPPSDRSPALKGLDLAISWQSGPWSWPSGSYVITLTTKAGPIAMPFVVE
jgi:hypothetical protein